MTTPQTGDDERWYRLDRLSDLATGQFDRLIEDITRTRGYWKDRPAAAASRSSRRGSAVVPSSA